MEPHNIVKNLLRTGIVLTITDNEKIRAKFNGPEPPKEALPFMSELKPNRQAVIEYLRNEKCLLQFQQMLDDVEDRLGVDPGNGYLTFHESSNQSHIDRIETKIDATWVRALNGDITAKEDFKLALDELRAAFFVSIDAYKRTRK